MNTIHAVSICASRNKHHTVWIHAFERRLQAQVSILRLQEYLSPRNVSLVPRRGKGVNHSTCSILPGRGERKCHSPRNILMAREMMQCTEAMTCS
eukprot:c30331_g1_i1 orf=1-282(-)